MVEYGAHVGLFQAFHESKCGKDKCIGVTYGYVAFPKTMAIQWVIITYAYKIGLTISCHQAL